MTSCFFWCAVAIVLTGCVPSGQFDDTRVLSSLEVSALPARVSNNATALVLQPGYFQIVSMAGLVNGKTWQHVSNRVYVFDSRSRKWHESRPLPGKVGRLAGTAVTVGQKVIYFGGYTVAKDLTEVSTPEVFAFDPVTNNYQPLPNMPIPVDDTVSALYRDRFVYLVSGWHDNDNVRNVQVLDTQTQTWAEATPFPGPPVFGHAGGIAGNTLVICDGVVVKQPDHPGDRRSFAATDACYAGKIDEFDPSKIHWQQIPAHPGRALYRSASTGNGQLVIFAGGSETPYNFNGTGYSGEPAQPSPRVHAWDVALNRWHTLPDLSEASMDHRNLLSAPDGALLLAGGMRADQTLRAEVTRYVHGDHQ